MGMWLINRLHHMWCEGGHCYSVGEECVCELFGCSAVEKYQLVMCEWANCGQLQVNMGNIRQIENVLHNCSR